jgi:GNAT superfamily N-acetyltransferase
VREILVENEENFTLVTLIDALFVHPAHRGKRIASLLVEYAVSETTTPFILSDPFDAAAQQFFIANGFSFTNPFGDTEEWMLYRHT